MEKAYIDRINVYGFKSYGLRKLTIPIGEGFTGVVGPNGSGKSNIGDSIVFALGLATAKSMRALKLSDLIFSSKGKSAEYAEVEVVFKNLGAFPLNDDEVSIYRKVEHNGRSIYKINGRIVKQYEVEELLSSAGIPKQGYNIVTQGDIFRFIKMTPAERRDLLSEIAGITEYEEKKQKAIQDLEETGERLNSAKLVLKEVKANLKRLEKEREDALQAVQIEERINEILDKIKGVKLFYLLNEKDTVLKDLEEIEQKIQKLYTQKENSIQKQKELLAVIKDLENRLNEIQESLLPVKEKEGSITAEIRTNNQKKSALEKEIEELKETLKEIQREKDEKIKEILSIEEEIKNLKNSLPEIESALEKAEKELEKKNRKFKEMEVGGSKARIDLGETEKEEVRLKQEQSNLIKEKNEIELSLGKITDKINLYKDEIQKLNEELDKLIKSQENIKSYTQNHEKKLLSLKSEINRLKIRKETLEKRQKDIREKIEKNFQKLAQVLASLSQVKEDRVMQVLNSKKIKGVYGQVADLIGLKDPELSSAVESAGGGRLKNIIVEDDKVAEECIRALRESNAGRGTFLPLNKIRGQQLHKAPLVRGVLGYVVDYIDFDPKIEKAVRFVFGDTLIVKDFDSARNLGIGKFRMVTVDGDIFEKSGAISGGSTKKSGSLLGRGTLENEKIQLEKLDDTLKKEESAVEEEYKKINYQIMEKEKEYYKIHNEGQSVTERNKEIQEKIGYINSRIKILEDEIFSLKKESFEKENKLENLNRSLKEIEKVLQKVQERKKAILERMENEGLHQLRKEWEDATNLVYSLREKKNDISNQIDKLKDRLENNLKVRIFQIENEKMKIEDNIKNKTKEIEGLKIAIENASKELSELWKGLKDKEKERDDLLNSIEEKREEVKVLRYEEENINEELTFSLEEKGKLEQKIDDLKFSIEQLKEEYDGEPIEGDIHSLEKELKELEHKRQQIGAVNQKAAEDYEEIEKRYKDLNEKLKTLIEEKKSIEELIDNLEKKKIEAFMEVYDEVNKNLKKVFRRLSPGGKAYLEIENEDNPLSGGVLLKAKPRGKDVKRLEIMSGGEKTLTALGFLFAVQQYRPAPFYYYDEVDAHLDDANARKIAELMKELSQDAQFIVVTLRDTMASYADRLIGVSAREGISNVYTLDMAEVL